METTSSRRPVPAAQRTPASIVQTPARWTGTATALVAGVIDLVSLPEAYARIQEMLNDPDASIQAVSQVISTDPNLAARVLRLSNSAFFGFQSRIDTITRAVNVLGLKLVHDLALATSAVRVFDRIPNQVMSMVKFWRRSVYCGVMAKLLAKQAEMTAVERFFIAGLMHRMGSLVMYYRLPDLSVQALTRSRLDSRPLVEIERELFGFDYATVGQELLRTWQLPPSLQIPVGCHTSPAKATDFIMETAIVHLASVIATAADSASESGEFVPDFDLQAFQTIGISDDAIEPLMQEADIQTSETIVLLTGNG